MGTFLLSLARTCKAYSSCSKVYGAIMVTRYLLLSCFSCLECMFGITINTYRRRFSVSSHLFTISVYGSLNDYSYLFMSRKCTAEVFPKSLIAW